MIKVFPGFCMLLMVITLSAQNKQTLPKGKLFIIGGGAISDAFRMQILNTAHWKKGDIIAAVTLASGYGDSAYSWMNDDFKRLTGEECLCFNFLGVIDSGGVKAKTLFFG